VQIIGLVFIIVGTVIQAAFRDYFAFFGNDVNSASLFIVVIGVICLIVSFFGCCGAFKENHCMIVTVRIRVYYFVTPRPTPKTDTPSTI